MGRPISFIFRDAKGNTSRTRMYFAVAAAAFETEAATVVTELGALSNANVTSSIDNAAANVYGTAATYLDVEDKARLVFQDASGALHRYEIPAPKASLFLADQETVDTANATLGTLVADMLANVVSRNGVALNSLVGGIRIRRRLHRRFSIFTHNPALTGPGE